MRWFWTSLLFLKSIAVCSQFLARNEPNFGPRMSLCAPAFQFHHFTLNNRVQFDFAAKRVCKIFSPQLRGWSPSTHLKHRADFIRTTGFRFSQPQTRLERNLYPAAVEDPAQLNVKVRLILLRSTLVDWYDGPEMALHDIDAISSQFEAFASTQPGWSMIYSNFTEGKGGVSALFKSKIGSEYDVEISLLGVEDYQRMMTMRDASAPNEPYMQLKMRALKYDQQTSVDAARAITEWMVQFSGMSWTTRDVPACGLGAVVDQGDSAELDQATVIPPSTCAALQKAPAGLDRPCVDTSALTDWLVPQLECKCDDVDLGVAGTTVVDEPERVEVDFGVLAGKRTRDVERYMEQVLAAADDLSDLPPPLSKRPAPSSATGAPSPEPAPASAAERASDAAFLAAQEAADAAQEAAVSDAPY